MGEQFWVKANYELNPNKKDNLSIEVPKSLANRNLRDVIDYMLSEELTKYNTLSDYEQNIFAEIKNYIEGYRQEETGRTTQYRLGFRLKAKDNSWYAEGKSDSMANIDLLIRDYVLPTEIETSGQKIKIDILTVIFQQHPTIGNKV